MYRICFIDEHLTTIDVCGDFTCLSDTFFSEISGYLNCNFTVLDPDGYILATCFDGDFSWC